MTIDQYIDQHIDPQSNLLVRLERATNLRTTQPRMLSGHMQGELLRMLVAISGAKTVLELGTFTGYSAICLASGFAAGESSTDDHVVHTVDINDELEELAASFFRESGLNIVQHFGAALEVAPRLDICFDLVFIDANKREYPEYYEMLFANNLVHSGSLILADNVLWSGKILQQPEAKDAQTQALLAFNTMVSKDNRVDKIILPIRDGISMIRVR